MKRTLEVVSGLAVLFTTLAYGHLVHHGAAVLHREAGVIQFVAATAFAVVVGIFSLMGAWLLLRGPRA